jgi:hypothetical protein
MWRSAPLVPAVDNHRRGGMQRQVALRQWIPDTGLPICDWQFADDGGGAAIAVVDDFEVIAALLGGEGHEAAVVEDGDLDPLPGSEPPACVERADKERSGCRGRARRPTARAS